VPADTGASGESELKAGPFSKRRDFGRRKENGAAFDAAPFHFLILLIELTSCR
jgi:hypothetical protein